MGKRFSRIYGMQQAGRAFDSPRQLWEALNLFNATQQNAADYMQVCLFMLWECCTPPSQL